MSQQTIDFGGYSITGDFSPEEPDVFYLPNGDPGYPGSPAEFSITDITVKDNSAMELVETIDSIILYKQKYCNGSPINIWEELADKCLEKMGDDFEYPEPEEKE